MHRNSLRGRLQRCIVILGVATKLIVTTNNCPDIVAEKHMLLETVLRAIKNKLTENQRHVIVLRFFERFSLKGIAMIMEESAGNIKVIQNRAVEALRKALDNQTEEYQFVEQDTLAQQA
jgi:RNA polymerase sigma factor (sigma-70 family)